MKKAIVLIYVLLIGAFAGFNYLKEKEYKEVVNEFNKKLENISYGEKYGTLNKEYENIISNINNSTNENIDDVNDTVLLIKKIENTYEEIINQNNILVEKKESLEEQNKLLTNQYNNLLEEERKRKTHIINGVSKINQYSIGYPTGCESVALTILLKYWGVNVSVADVASILPKGSKPYYENGIKYGGNPYLEFIGNPTDPYSYGVYDIPIENVANHFKNGIINGKGMTLNQVLEIVKQNRPVIVWSSMNMGIPHYTNSWTYKPTGEKINWLADLHAIVVIGYNENQVITTDSLTGSVRYFNRSTFENRYNAFGKRALYY